MARGHVEDTVCQRGENVTAYHIPKYIYLLGRHPSPDEQRQGFRQSLPPPS